jgi:SAM-dependent methyltransferase
MSESPLAKQAYEAIADSYAAMIETKPHNAYCERPAMIAMWPHLVGKRVLDAGCGPGLYAQLLNQRGARVTAVDVSDRMLQHARERLGPAADLRIVNLEQPLTMFADQEFDFINAPLCLDYVGRWRELFKEFYRILSSSGSVQFSCGHPAADAELFKTDNYYSIERVQCTWKGFGKPVVMPSFRRSLAEILMPLVEAGFRLTAIVEPQPTEDFLASDPLRYQRIVHRPCFLCIQAAKG